MAWCSGLQPDARVFAFPAADSPARLSRPLLQVVRHKIKGFAANAVGGAVPGYPCPPFKVIILDEADAMTGVRPASAADTL